MNESKLCDTLFSKHHVLECERSHANDGERRARASQMDSHACVRILCLRFLICGRRRTRFHHLSLTHPTNQSPLARLLGEGPQHQSRATAWPGARVPAASPRAMEGRPIDLTPTLSHSHSLISPCIPYPSFLHLSSIPHSLSCTQPIAQEEGRWRVTLS